MDETKDASFVLFQMPDGASIHTMEFIRDQMRALDIKCVVVPSSVKVTLVRMDQPNGRIERIKDAIERSPKTQECAPKYRKWEFDRAGANITANGFRDPSRYAGSTDGSGMW